MKKNKRPSFGTWLTRPDPAITELMASSVHFSWLTVDLEHSTIDLQQAENMIRIIQLCGKEAYVRLSQNDPVQIKWVLDAGADGIIVPMVNSRAEVLSALNALHYPPKGTRGVGLARAQRYGLSFKHYRDAIEPKLKLFIQIEHKDAVECIDEIFSTGGLSGYFIGPYDLSASLGRPGDFGNTRLCRYLAAVKKAGERHGVPAGFHAVEPDAALIRGKIREGYALIAVSLEMLLLGRALEDLFGKMRA